MENAHTQIQTLPQMSAEGRWQVINLQDRTEMRFDTKGEALDYALMESLNEIVFAIFDPYQEAITEIAYIGVLWEPQW